MSFKNIRGQEGPLNIIREDLKQGRLAGGYLFAGPDGIGKKIFARTLAKALNCEHGGFDACGACSSCLKIEKNQHPDIHIIELPGCEDELIASGTEAIKIEEIRNLQKEISLRPYEGKYKVFIIDEAQNLTAEASNALLKILEEPPRQSVIILISSKPNLLFKTIASRCRVVRFHPLERSQLEDILRNEYRLHDDLAHYLAFFCEGRLGKALRYKDTNILLLKNQIIDQLAIASGATVEGMGIKDRLQALAMLNVLAAWFRDIYVAQAGLGPGEFINRDRKQDIFRVKEQIPAAQVYDLIKSISDWTLCVEQNVNIKLLLAHIQAETPRV